ncbi:glycosyltransferase family 2 protein [Candidatus Cryosericum odellii]|uniref:Glycosyltransferase family 2 protein n=1 Tax=Candidatus Cryosericum odellii TaxID=2290917 RepID=A0A398CWY1_9BACT|nr:glycosyltransferase family 2 protein [Candidatus Cryosericum odellii]
MHGVASAVCFVAARYFVKETQYAIGGHSEPVRAGVSGSQETVAPGTRSVAACIVSYNPGPEARLTLYSVLPQVSKVFVIDNASTRQSEMALSDLCAELSVALTVNNENTGVAGAFNQAASMAISQGYEWMLLMDQDTVAPVGLVQRLMRGVDRWGGIRLPAVLCPLSLESDPSGHQSAVPDADTAVGACMSAGSMVRLAAWKAVGGYDESFFVDYVDHDFCFRCRQHGWEVVQVCGAVMVHSPGSPIRHRFLWKRPATSNRSALRGYYMARNRILFYRKYWRFDTRWVLRDVCNAVKEVVLVVLFESSKREKLNAIGVGVLDGCRGLSGKTQRQWFVSKR